jgi:hypothetical protein
VNPDVSDEWMRWKIDESKRLQDPALMPAKALCGGSPIDWSLVDHSCRGGSVPDGPAGDRQKSQ